MGHAYEERLLPDRHALLFQMQAYAVAEPEIRAHVREGSRSLRQAVAELAGRRGGRHVGLLRDGMMLNVVAMLDFDWVYPE